MRNETTIKVPKKYEGMIELIEKDCDGYWAYAKEGYRFAGMECGTAHEFTQKELLAMIRTLEVVVEEVVEAPEQETTGTIESKGGKFLHTITKNGEVVGTRNSVKEYGFAIVLEYDGTTCIHKYTNSRDAALKELRKCMTKEWFTECEIIEFK